MGSISGIAGASAHKTVQGQQPQPGKGAHFLSSLPLPPAQILFAQTVPLAVAFGSFWPFPFGKVTSPSLFLLSTLLVRIL